MDDVIIKGQEIDGINIKVGSINAIIDDFTKILDTVIV
jgi:hypothetical protein